MTNIMTISLLLVFFICSGCATKINRDNSATTKIDRDNPAETKIDWNNPAESENRVYIKNDTFKKQTTFYSPNICSIYKWKLLIRAWKRYDSTCMTFQIYIKEIHQGDWHLYSQAYDSNGNSLNIISIKGDVDFNTHELEEHYGLNVNRKYLEDSVTTGIEIRLYGDSNRNIFIPGGYIKGFLSKIDLYNKQK